MTAREARSISIAMPTEIIATEAGSVTSTANIRKHFPALQRIHNGFPVAYFDGPGGTQVPRSVVEAMNDYLYHHNANTHWAYPSSEETDAIIESARHTLADFLNAAPNEIAFGANMTTLTFHLARALGRNFSAGDEIVVTELDHHANVAPWRALEKDYGLKVRTVKMTPENGQLDWEDFSRQLNKRTKLVAIGAASNALGTVNDIPRAITMARSLGALVFVDAVHYAPHELIDVRAWDCDFLSCSAYKFYGPHIGILFAKEKLLGSLDFPKLIPAPDTAPERAETGTQNHEGIIGAAAAVEFLASIAQGTTRRDRLRASFEELCERGSKLLDRLWTGLTSIDGVDLYGPPLDTTRTPTVAFTVNGVPSTSIARRLAACGIFASDGDFYAMTVMERLGRAKDGVVRAGCSCYTTVQEVERLVDAVREIAHEIN